MQIAAFILGGLLGGVAVWLLVRTRTAASVSLLEARLAHERMTADEKLELVKRANEEWERRFEALSAKSLKSNNEAFLSLARTQLDPLQDVLKTFDTHTRQLEKERQNAYAGLREQVQALAKDAQGLRLETGNLVTALRTPHVRGRWGEIQLKRVVELAGMVDHCDFVEQASNRDGDGKLLRPDLIVKLPGGKNVVIDSKVPLEAYLDAMRTDIDDDERRRHVLRHARLVRQHIDALGAKQYWRQFSPTPEFVVMFMPDESFFRCALEGDPSLIEVGAEAGVIFASPITLIGLLRTVAYAWQQETIAESARAVSGLGRELYERLGTFAKHFSKVGRNLDTAVGAYNEAVGSLESRVLVTARKLEQHGASIGELPDVAPLERQSRPLVADELRDVETLRELPSADAA